MVRCVLICPLFFHPSELALCSPRQAPPPTAGLCHVISTWVKSSTTQTDCTELDHNENADFTVPLFCLPMRLWELQGSLALRSDGLGSEIRFCLTLCSLAEERGLILAPVAALTMGLSFRGRDRERPCSPDNPVCILCYPCLLPHLINSSAPVVFVLGSNPPVQHRRLLYSTYTSGY